MCKKDQVNITERVKKGGKRMLAMLKRGGRWAKGLPNEENKKIGGDGLHF